MKKLNLFIFLGILVSLMIVFEFLDYKISSSFEAKQNWFTDLFDVYGKSIIMFPFFVCLISQLNYVILKHTVYSRIRWIWLFGILFMLIYTILVILWSKNFSYKPTTFKTASILTLVPLLSLSYIIFFVNSKLMLSEEMAYFMKKEIVNVVWYIFLSYLTLIIFKEFFGRPRPINILPEGHSDNDFYYAFEPCFKNYMHRSGSFFSGHTLSACMVFSLVYFVPKTFKKTKYILCSIIGITVILTGISRILNHAHWPTDVTFALIVALIYYWSTPLMVDSFAKLNNMMERKNV